MSVNDLLPTETVKTRDAAEAVLYLWQLFGKEHHVFETWISHVNQHWPDLAAMMFTAARDQ